MALSQAARRSSGTLLPIARWCTGRDVVGEIGAGSRDRVEAAPHWPTATPPRDWSGRPAAAGVPCAVGERRDDSCARPPPGRRRLPSRQRRLRHQPAEQTCLALAPRSMTRLGKAGAIDLSTSHDQLTFERPAPSRRIGAWTRNPPTRCPSAPRHSLDRALETLQDSQHPDRRDPRGGGRSLRPP